MAHRIIVHIRDNEDASRGHGSSLKAGRTSKIETGIYPTLSCSNATPLGRFLMAVVNNDHSAALLATGEALKAMKEENG